jgi:tetratricopeptide (TPR) repeat protein
MIPQEWREIYAKYQEAIQHYQQSNQTAPSPSSGQALEQAAGYCHSILKHPAFADPPASFRLLMLGEGGETHLDLYKLRGREEDLNDAFSFLEAALELAPADSAMLPELKSKMAIASSIFSPWALGLSLESAL